MAASFYCLGRHEEAEHYWIRAIQQRPSYLEAVEHLVGLLYKKRSEEAIDIICYVQKALGAVGQPALAGLASRGEASDDHKSNSRIVGGQSMSLQSVFDLSSGGYGSSGYTLDGSENGRILALIHAKGTMLYGLKDVDGAARAFEEAVLISVGRNTKGVRELVRGIQNSLSRVAPSAPAGQPLLLAPDKARHAARLLFGGDGELPGLRWVNDPTPRRAAVQTTSNSLLSLAKIFQDSMAGGSSNSTLARPSSGVGDILALYYLSLSLQESPSTANNVGILLAGIPQTNSNPVIDSTSPSHVQTGIPGILPGSGLALALAYYNYGLRLDPKHVHLHTNLGSLLKDVGQLDLAIQMYQRAVVCDGTFDIALTNLANAVKDKGRISEAIGYYRRAVAANPGMQSVFGFHDTGRVRAFCYATTPSDKSSYRAQIEKEAPVFRDVSSWTPERLIKQISYDGIHILVNLNGYTRGARNEIFAARPAPIQMSFMGFAGTLGAEWCDYILADTTAIPSSTLRPWRQNTTLEDVFHDETEADAGEWIYTENIIFCRDTFFCCDHAQSSPSIERNMTWSDEQNRRWTMRKELFPDLQDDTVILANFNQLYKIDPSTFRSWLRILAQVPKAILWLLRFPEAGEANLRRTAELWAGPEVASRLVFTDVAQKSQHISRARVCDLFLDTPECNAHTTAADVLWSSTPLLTYPRYPYKMCARMAASILKGALPRTPEGQRVAGELIATSEKMYEKSAIELAVGLSYSRAASGEVGGSGRLADMRKLLWHNKWTCGLFDTRRWVRDVETAYEEAWKRWESGEGGDIYL
ncbi:tetratricopeptide-like protein [Beauveria bassiana ARSEF 2860]|uniref:protein O-GlcNAc transferase n=1 Tax=Beauveria bassiana (strain ARSEF 2860) TaxID=655819 RepID=J5JL89_BEAB2|nr:tetratricopeptide-like protein [Beauveria bassiana ARSEF 2860]EJP63936.1 tetratricopeptide-like protein [Beauveria bassiana ARSEF 2860]